MVTLKQKTINGMFWTISSRLSVQIVQLAVSIILARLLVPSEFGLIGMLTIFTALSQAILDGGFGSALIQKKESNQTDSSSIFYINILIGILLAITLILGAPLIASFYQQPILAPMLRVLSLSLIINSFSLVQTSLLTKNMDFKAQFKVQFLAISLSGLIGITLAYLGYGVWSLVIQSVTNYLFRAILLWLISNWRPTREFSWSSLKNMFSFGSKLLFSSLLYTFFNNIYEAFIGKVYSVTEVGYFTRASTFETAATMATSQPIDQVTFPALAPLQDNDIVLKQAYRKAIKLSQFLHFPLMIGLITVAQPLFLLILTEKWAPSIPYFQLLCVVGLLTPLQNLNLNILKVKGRSDLVFKLEIIKRFNLIVAIAITFRWGIMALIIGKVITAFIAYFLNSSYSGKLVGYGQIDQIKDISPSLITALIMGMIMYLVNFLSISTNFLKLVVEMIMGVSVYYLLNMLIHSPELYETKGIITNYINSGLKRIRKRV